RHSNLPQICILRLAGKQSRKAVVWPRLQWRLLMPEPVIVSAVRTAVGRAYKGSLRATRPDDLAAVVIKEALARVAVLDPKEIDDVILGCAMPEGEQGMNVARIAA